MQFYRRYRKYLSYVALAFIQAYVPAVFAMIVIHACNGCPNPRQMRTRVIRCDRDLAYLRQMRVATRSSSNPRDQTRGRIPRSRQRRNRDDCHDRVKRFNCGKRRRVSIDATDFAENHRPIARSRETGVHARSHLTFASRAAIIYATN